MTIEGTNICMTCGQRKEMYQDESICRDCLKKHEEDRTSKSPNWPIYNGTIYITENISRAIEVKKKAPPEDRESYLKYTQTSMREVIQEMLEERAKDILYVDAMTPSGIELVTEVDSEKQQTQNDEPDFGQK